MSAAGLPADLVSRLAAGLWAEAIAARLLWASLAGTVAVALVALAVRLAPRLPPALRAALWWLACMKLLLALLPLPPLALPLPAALASRLPLPTPLSSPSPHLALLSSSSRHLARRAGARLDRAVAPRRGAFLAEEGAAGSAAAHPALRPSASSYWRPAGALAFVALWVAGLALRARDTVRQLAVARRILRNARPAGSPALLARFAELSEKAGLARPPALLVSAEVASPVTVARAAGLGAPAVVLPAGWALAEPELGIELDMALCHELAHVRRGDLRLGWVPALAARLFFFHPLARLAVREHALAREAACDAFVLARLAAPPAAYARLLLDLGAAAGRLHGAAALGAAPPPGTLKRRLLMLDATTRRPRPAWLVLTGIAALAALVPLRIAGTPLAAVPGAAAVVPAAAAGDTAHEVRRHARKSKAADAYMLISQGIGIGQGGTSADAALAGELARGGPVLWFRRDDMEFVIRDRVLLARLDQLFAPQQELAGKEVSLMARRRKLGARERELRAKEGALGGRLAGLAQPGDSAARERADVSRQKEALDRKLEELDRQLASLDLKQGALFSEPESASDEVDAKLKILMDDAIIHGLALEVR